MSGTTLNTLYILCVSFNHHLQKQLLRLEEVLPSTQDHMFDKGSGQGSNPGVFLQTPHPWSWCMLLTSGYEWPRMREWGPFCINHIPWHREYNFNRLHLFPRQKGPTLRQKLHRTMCNWIALFGELSWDLSPQPALLPRNLILSIWKLPLKQWDWGR